MKKASNSSIYRNGDCRSQIKAMYDRSLERLGIPFEETFLDTTYGKTHVLIAGKKDGRPLVLFQGGNFLNPLTLEWFLGLADEYRIYAPDTPGHPGKSAQGRPHPHDGSYGRWALEVIDTLGIETADVAGASYGAGIIISAATLAPARISGAILIVPSGIINMPMLPLIRKILLPMLAYRLTGSRTMLLRSIRPMFSEEPGKEWVESFRLIYDCVKLETNMPKPVRKDDLGGFTAPVLVLAGEKDIFYPGRAVVTRAKDVFQNLIAAEIMEGYNHIPPREGYKHICDRMKRFLTERK